MVTYQKTFSPLATGTYQQWPACYVGGWGGSHLTAVTDDSDSTYLYSYTGGGYTSFIDTYTISAYTDTAVINSVRVYSRSYAQGHWGGIQEVLYIGGVLYYGTGHNYTSPTTSYSDWVLSPDTGIAWTWAEISGMEIGVKGWQSNSEFIRGIKVWMDVYYEYVSSTMPVGGVMIGPYLIG